MAILESVPTVGGTGQCEGGGQCWWENDSICKLQGTKENMNLKAKDLNAADFNEHRVSAGKFPCGSNLWKKSVPERVDGSLN